ncbi:MAG: ATP-binding protein [Luteolibacter sp.]
MKRFWMRSLTGQWVAFMLLALALSQLLYFFIYRAEQARTVQELRRDEFLARSASVSRLVDTVDPTLHPEILRATSTAAVRFWLASEAPGDPADWQNTARDRLLESSRPPEASDLTTQADGHWESLSAESQFGDSHARLMRLGKWNGFGLAVPAKNGLWLNAVYAKPGAVTGPPPLYYVSLGFTAVLLSLVSIMVARRVGRPLRRLTEAAERLGRGEEVPPLPEDGADDVRRTSIAFNQMQSRLRRFVQDRTRMVAAISHDLRTPITSMRLRAEFVEDEETREKMISTLDEMKAMTEATLAFAREDATSEETRSVDMNALLGSLCADLSELGLQVDFAEGDRIPCNCRPDALRRAFRNVIENGVRYGNRARVSVAASDDDLEILVEDDGPGIAVADREKVFDPFVRLEQSRNRSTGGVGLGLSIARSIIRRHGGDIELMDGSPGLRVRLHLPRQQPD